MFSDDQFTVDIVVSVGVDIIPHRAGPSRILNTSFEILAK